MRLPHERLLSSSSPRSVFNGVLVDGNALVGDRLLRTDKGLRMRRVRRVRRADLDVGPSLLLRLDEAGPVLWILVAEPPPDEFPVLLECLYGPMLLDLPPQLFVVLGKLVQERDYQFPMGWIVLDFLGARQEAVVLGLKEVAAEPMACAKRTAFLFDECLGRVRQRWVGMAARKRWHDPYARFLRVRWNCIAICRRHREGSLMGRTNRRLIRWTGSQIGCLACLGEFILEPLDNAFDGLVKK